MLSHPRAMADRLGVDVNESTARNEAWRAVQGFEGLYKVSDLGRVRSLDRTVVRRRYGKLIPVRRVGRRLRFDLDKDGYLRVRLYRDGVSLKVAAHVLVLESFVGPRPRGLEALHCDGNPANNALSNLRWGTTSENQRDRVLHGRHFASERTHCPRDHQLVMPNLDPYQLKRGWRTCLACKRAHDNRRKALRAGRLFDFQADSDKRYAMIMG